VTAQRWRTLFRGPDRVPGSPEAPDKAGIKAWNKAWNKAWIETLNNAYVDQQELQGALDDTPGLGPRPLVVKRVASRLSRTETEAAWLLGTSLAGSARRLATGGLSRHLFDALIVGGIAILAILPVLAWRQAVGNDAEAKANAAAALARPRLEATHDLAAYVPLTAGDVVARATKTPLEADALVANAVGHYPPSTIEKGKTVEPPRLSKRRTALVRFSVLRVALKVKPAFDVSAFPISVNLVLSARGAPPAGAVLDGELFALEPDGITATLAIPEARVPEAARFLGDSDAYLALPVP